MMQPEPFKTLALNYPKLRIAILGDFCLDRYFEIDSERQEISIETGLPVYNISNTRCQPGAAGTILNNLAALGIGEILPVGFCGDDGEGWELRRCLQNKPGVRLDYFVTTPLRRTFTYTKPLLLKTGKPPEELNRFDTKNWDASPAPLVEKFCQAAMELMSQVDAFIVMDQVDIAETGVISRVLLKTLGDISTSHPKFLIVADSRRGLRGFPPVIFKMNGDELAKLMGVPTPPDLDSIKKLALDLAVKQRRRTFVTLAERGMVGADPSGEVVHRPSLPLRGSIDIVGAGDSVTANLTAALAAGASLAQSVEIANAAASIVIHQLGTTGVATVSEIENLLS